MNCPRRSENPGPFKFPQEDQWRDDNTCSYCGSFNPDKLMERIEAGTVEIGPTDKNYKIYLKSLNTDPIGIKFYFQHFSNDQQINFIELINQGKIKFGYPGHFYSLPFFCRRDI